MVAPTSVLVRTGEMYSGVVCCRSLYSRWGGGMVLDGALRGSHCHQRRKHVGTTSLCCRSWSFEPRPAISEMQWSKGRNGLSNFPPRPSFPLPLYLVNATTFRLPMDASATVPPGSSLLPPRSIWCLVDLTTLLCCCCTRRVVVLFWWG